MIRALYSAATGMSAQETNIDVIANNLANVNTTGFKKSRADFQDLMYQYLMEPGAPTSQTTESPSGIQVGLGVKTAAVQKVFTQGDLAASGGQLDVAIEGDGFFTVTLPDGTSAYSRAGAFQVSSTGQIVTSDGYPVSGPGTIPTDFESISIAKDGTVSVKQPGTAAPTSIGQFTAARFPNNAGLRAIGRNLYSETGASGTAVPGTFDSSGMGRLAQGFLETSNVSVVSQVIEMITAQRAYEASQKGVQAADEMTSQAINLKR